jgi:hypothetical protein
LVGRRLSQVIKYSGDDEGLNDQFYSVRRPFVLISEHLIRSSGPLDYTPSDVSTGFSSAVGFRLHFVLGKSRQRRANLTSIGRSVWRHWRKRKCSESRQMAADGRCMDLNIRGRI